MWLTTMDNKPVLNGVSYRQRTWTQVNVDTVMTGFETGTTSGTYGPGDVIELTARFNRNLGDTYDYGFVVTTNAGGVNLYPQAGSAVAVGQLILANTASTDGRPLVVTDVQKRFQSCRA